MHFCDELTWRGLLQDNSDPEGLRKLPQGTVFYVGFDPTAPSLQIGNLIPLVVAMLLARHGLRPLILFGGATGSIGDPSGKNVERQLLAREVIEQNITNQQAQVRAIFSRKGLTVDFVDNYDWTKDVSILDFLRDTGKYFTVNYMIAKEVIKTRLQGDGISFTEFSYMLLQAFDYGHLHKKFGCKLQVGGSDQWGNITAGLELIRKKWGSEAYAFSWPLLLNAQGKKFGKTEGGTLWLDGAMTSPYKLHQFLLGAEDSDAIRYLKLFTDLSQEQITEIEHKHAQTPEERHAQKVLADWICTIVHGEEATNSAKRCAQVLFGGPLEGVSQGDLEQIFADAPSVGFSRSELAPLTTLDLLVKSEVVKSKGEARRLIESGGAYLNNVRIADGAAPLSPYLSSATSVIVLRSGKKNYRLVKLS